MSMGCPGGSRKVMRAIRALYRRFSRTDGVTRHSIFSPLFLPRCFEDVYCVKRALRRLFVLEVGKYIAVVGEMLSHSCYHRFTLFGRVGRLAITIVSVVGSEHVQIGRAHV